MKISTKLFALGGLVWAVSALDRKQQRALASRGGASRTGTTSSSAGIVDAEIINAGLSEVDPEGLTQMGEAVDPEATEAAHEDVPEQRARMPVRGRDIP